MFIHPTVATRLVAHYRAEMEARAQNYRLRRQAIIFARMARPRIPARAPRHWRWRYL